jgi:hypothetical protein
MKKQGEEFEKSLFSQFPLFLKQEIIFTGYDSEIIALYFQGMSSKI